MNNIIPKAIRVIDSCETFTHLTGAINYVSNGVKSKLIKRADAWGLYHRIEKRSAQIKVKENVISN